MLLMLLLLYTKALTHVSSCPSPSLITVQILPKLQPKVAHIDTYIRTKTWIALPFTSENVKERAIANGTATTDSAADVLIDPETSNPPYTEAEKKAFAEDSELLRRYRKKIEQENNSRFAGSTLKGSPGAEAAIPRLTAIMKKRLAKKPELADLLIPDWHVGCRRRECLSSLLIS